MAVRPGAWQPPDAYYAFLTSGHLDSDNGWNAWSSGIVANKLITIDRGVPV